MRTLGAQLWIHKPSVQSLQARRLELLMVALCRNHVRAVITIVHMKVGKLSEGLTTITMLAVGGLEKSVSASMQPV